MINDASNASKNLKVPYLKQIKVLTVQMWTLMGTSSERNCSQHTWCYDAMSHICYKSRTAVQERARNRVALPVEVALKRFYLFQKLRYGLLKIWWFEKRGSRSVNLFHHFLFDQMHIVGNEEAFKVTKAWLRF